jgi:hypothetical protein
MRRILIGSSAAMLAFLAFGAAPATACDWGCRGPVYVYGPPAPIYVVPRVYIEPPFYFYAPPYYRRYRARYYDRPYYGVQRGYYRTYYDGGRRGRGRWRR